MLEIHDTQFPDSRFLWRAVVCLTGWVHRDKSFQGIYIALDQDGELSFYARRSPEGSQAPLKERSWRIRPARLRKIVRTIFEADPEYFDLSAEVRRLEAERAAKTEKGNATDPH